MRSLASLLLLALLLALAPSTLLAQDADPGESFYAEGENGFAKKAANRVWKAADAARKKTLYAYARTQAERVIGIDPGHKKARDYLCYERKGREWRLDEKKAARLPRKNERAQGQTAADLGKREREWRDKVLAPANAAVADLYAKLAQQCALNGHSEQAKRGRLKALSLNPDHAAVRKALGHEKFGGVWLTKAQVRARKSASQPVRMKDSSDLADLLDTRVNAVESANFRAAGSAPEVRITDWTKGCETVITYMLTDLGRDPNESPFRSKVEMCFSSTMKQWDRWLEVRCPRNRDFFRKHSFYRLPATLVIGVRNESGVPDAQVADNAAHCTAHLVNEVLFGLNRRAWLDEGMAYHYVLRARGTTKSYCVSHDPRKYAHEGGSDEMKGWSTESFFKPIVRQLVEKGDDAPLRALLTKKPQDLDFEASLKAWSFVGWQLDTDRDEFVKLLESLRASGDDAETLQKHFGMSMEDLDNAWRAYVRRTH